MSYTVTTKKTWASILDNIEESFRKWRGVTTWGVECLLAPRSSTKTYQSQEERTVTLRYARRGAGDGHSKDYTITMARQSRAVDNLLVIWLILETLRLNAARGYAEQVAAVYRQEFPALPAPGQASASAPELMTHYYRLLYVQRDAPLAVCEAAYRALAKDAHGDVGGSDERMRTLNAAIEQIRKERQQ